METNYTEILKNNYKITQKNIEILAKAFEMDKLKIAKILTEVFEELGNNLFDDFTTGDFIINNNISRITEFNGNMLERILAERKVKIDIGGLLYFIYKTFENHKDYFYDYYYGELGE